MIRKGSTAKAALAASVQDVLDAFRRENKWQRRQQEIVRRLDRDGEAFLRYFVNRDGCTRVRFVEPDQIVTPSGRASDPAASFGILTDSDDVETVICYYVDGRPVDAAEIQHRKANVDENVKRGLPLFFPVRKNLRRAEKLLRNMSVVAEIQSAIALIRKHQGGTRSGVQQFAASQTDVTLTQAATGRSTNFRRFGPGTILDAPGGIEYDFPAAGLDAANFVAVLQAELRAIASRLVMPEFMLTSDASNANYASTMVAEGPAMRMFSRLQADLVNDDLDVMWRVVRAAVDAGGLPAAALCDIEIQVSPPSLETRNQRQEAEVHQIEYQNGILSPQTWCRRRGLDYDQEQMNLAQHNQRPQEVAGYESLVAAAPTELVEPVKHAPTASLDSARVQDLLEFVRAITEAGWDPAKHPRGGNPQNRGEFSSAGGGAGGGSGDGASASPQPADPQAGGATDSTQSAADQPAPKASPPVHLAAQKIEKKKPAAAPEKTESGQEGTTHEQIAKAVKDVTGSISKEDITNETWFALRVTIGGERAYVRGEANGSITILAKVNGVVVAANIDAKGVISYGQLDPRGGFAKNTDLTNAIQAARVAAEKKRVEAELEEPEVGAGEAKLGGIAVVLKGAFGSLKATTKPGEDGSHDITLEIGVDLCTSEPAREKYGSHPKDKSSRV